MANDTSRHSQSSDALSSGGDAVIAVRVGVDAIRTVRTALMDVALAISSRPGVAGYVMLAESAITGARVREEWERAAAVIRPEIASRLTICVERAGRVEGVPGDPPEAIIAELRRAVRAAKEGSSTAKPREGYGFVIFKLLLHQWLTSEEPVTSEWLGRAAGCSYPTVARALKELGSVIERSSDRRVRLRYFPREEFDRMVANSAAARDTVRFADRSGQPRTPEARVRRLEKIGPKGVAIGGVLGARHYHAELDLVGTPRLDLSVHSEAAGLEFIEELDAALVREDDPHQPASVVVHRVWHADPLFRPREGGLAWADPVECLLDLHEMRLEGQAQGFLKKMHGLRVEKAGSPHASLDPRAMTEAAMRLETSAERSPGLRGRNSSNSSMRGIDTKD